MVGDNLTNIQLQQLVDRTLISADKDQDGKISFEEFCDYCKDMKIAEMLSMKLFWFISSINNLFLFSLIIPLDSLFNKFRFFSSILYNSEEKLFN